MKTNKYKNLKKCFKKPGNQTPCHSRFPAGSFAVRFGDHIRSGIICGPPAQYFRMALLLLSQIKGHLYFLFV